VEDGEY
jgi:hypothetical protein